MPLTLFIDICNAVEVLDSNQSNEGDNGIYFYLAGDDFEKMVGDVELDEYRLDVIQVGSRHWVGTVIAWKGEDGADAYGKRESGSSQGQWDAGDKMILQSCNGENQLFRISYCPPHVKKA